MLSIFFTAAHLSHRRYRADERAGYADINLRRNRIRRHRDLFRRADFVESRLPAASSPERSQTGKFKFLSHARFLHHLLYPCDILPAGTN